MVRNILAGSAALALTVTLASLPPPATAHPVAHPDGPRITNLRPAPGEVVPAGGVLVAALAASDHTITSHRLTVADTEVPSTRGEGESHPTIAGTVTLEPGEYIARVRVTDAGGRDGERAWRFTVNGMQLRRVAGAGRVETAVGMSQDLYPQAQTAASAVLARADDYPDALAGVPLAHAGDGPLLLTDGESLSEGTAGELRRAVEPGATVYLLGGTAALSVSVESEVAELGFDPRRVAGESRHGTAAAIASELAGADAAVVASGRSFADALAASSPAAQAGWPILLAEPDSLPEETRVALQDGDVATVYLVGGSAAVGEQVAAAVRALDVDVVRIAGSGRYETAAAVTRTFFTSPASAGVASGETFPDALAGGRHAAAREMPVLLTARHALPGAQAAQVADYQLDGAVVYGGPGAVDDFVLTDLRRARSNRGGPVVTGITPHAGDEVNTFDQLVVRFDRPITPEHSTLYVSLGGHEVPGTVETGEFSDTLVYTATEFPTTVATDTRYLLRLTGIAYDGSGWHRVDHRLTYRKLDLSRGDAGPAVRELQERLTAQGYWLGGIDGVFGGLTHQAVMAFQKAHRLDPDGVYDLQTRRLLESNPPRPGARSTSGRVIEIDLDRQILMVVTDGQVNWTFNTSTGHGQVYEFQGRTFRANTTTGVRRITREIDGMREAERGQLWRPKYFDDSRGIAIHGSTSVPNYPASAGCVRVTNAAMDFIWQAGLAPIGTTVWVYPENYYG